MFDDGSRKSVAQLVGLTETTDRGTASFIWSMLEDLKASQNIEDYSNALEKISVGIGTKTDDKILELLSEGEGSFKFDGLGATFDAVIGLVGITTEIATKNMLYDEWYDEIDEYLSEMNPDSAAYKAVMNVLNELKNYSGTDIAEMLKANIDDGALVVTDAVAAAAISAGIKCVSAPVAAAIDGAQIILALGNVDGKSEALSNLPSYVSAFRDRYANRVATMLTEYVAEPTQAKYDELLRETQSLYEEIFLAQERAYQYEKEVFSAVVQFHIGNGPSLSEYRSTVDEELRITREAFVYMGFDVSFFGD